MCFVSLGDDCCAISGGYNQGGRDRDEYRKL